MSILNVEKFVELGYIPEEIIPSISSKKLSGIVMGLLGTIKNLGPYSSMCCEYNIPRLKNLRRHLGIPNPLHQIKLFKVIADNWGILESFYSNSMLSLSKPVISLKNRAIARQCSFGELAKKNVLLKGSARYILKTDVSRYYPTIYTHSISWALHSKPKAKSSTGSSILGNQIDKGVRNTQDKQSVGIPIGPDSSLIISEIIGTKMDVDLCKKMGGIKGYRYVDDYNLYFESLSEAEEANYTIYNIMRYYELECNPDKTEIYEIPEIIEKRWVRELKQFDFRSNSNQENDLISFFSMAFELHREFVDEPILKYALSRIKNLNILEKSWKIYESFILESISVDPSVLPIAVNILGTYKDLDYSLDKIKIGESISEIIKYYSKYKYSFELSWILWLAKILEISIDVEASDRLQNIDDPVVILICLDLINNKLISSDFDTTLWESFMNADHLYSKYWLIAYEALKKQWLPAQRNVNYLQKDSFFSILDDNNIEFYDTKTQQASINLVSRHESKQPKIKTSYGDFII